MNRLEGIMNVRTILKSAALGAGICIFAIGVALAQGGPGAGAGPGAGSGKMRGHEIRKACRDEVKSDLRGSERRDAMKKCIDEKRKAAGVLTREERQARREKAREDMKACREKLKEQRFTEAERRGAMQTCMLEKDPTRAKAMTCRAEAETKKLERGTKEFRDFMRQCNTAP
jgi:hypothetical protein